MDATERGDRLDRAAKALTLHLLWIVPLVVLPIVFSMRTFHDLFQSGAISAAQAAREIVRGHGFSTLWAHPIEIALRGGSFPRPDFLGSPLHPLLLAIFFGAREASDKVAAAVSVLFLMATGIVLFRLTHRAFGRTAATLAVLFLVLGLPTLVYAVSGGSVTISMFLVTLAALLLFAPECSLRRAGAAGAVLSLAYLTDATNLALVIPLGLFALLASRPQRWGRLALFAVGFAVVAAPWWVRNALVVGDPFYSLRHYWPEMFVPAHPGFTLFRSTDTSALGVWGFLRENPTALVRKMVMGVRDLHTLVPTAFGIYIAAFFIAGVLHPLQDDRTRLLRKCLYLALGLQIVLGAAQNASADFVISLLPLTLVFACGFFVHLLQRVEARSARAWAVAVFLAVAAYPTLVTMLAPGTGPDPSRGNLMNVGQLPEGTVVLSDVPWSVAWHADRPAILLPLRQEDFEAVQKRADVGAIYLSYRLQTWPAQEQARPWRIIERYGVKGYVRVWPRPQQPGEALFVREDLAAMLPAAPAPPERGLAPAEEPGRPGAL